jgi:hypothetical protein
MQVHFIGHHKNDAMPKKRRERERERERERDERKEKRSDA